MATISFLISHLGRWSRLKCLVASCVIGLLFLLTFYGELNYLWKRLPHRSADITDTEEPKVTLTADTLTQISRLGSDGRCAPIRNVLFLKTHKTGSSTVANIFFRYGDSRGLSFVLGSDPMIGWPRRFRLSHTLPRNGHRANFLCSHTRYNKKPMRLLFPKDISIYITILRNPVDQFESVFNYVEFGEVFGFGTDPTESITSFLRNGIPFKDITKARSSVLARNPMMYDFGLDYQYYQNATAVRNYIAFLEKEFDLVMIMEYFEESMVLMKRLLCWEFDDLFHIKSNERQEKERAKMSDNLKENIKRWNKADMLLYEHFNRTFWRQIRMEGEGFYDDLKTFRQMNDEMNRKCFSGMTLQQVYAGKFVKAPALNPNLTAELKEKCERMTRKENSYLSHLKSKQSSKSAGYIQATLDDEGPDNKISWDVAQDFKYNPLPV
ncbi:galactose-3-O-sulfotransferase 2-like [Oculina patagonica]